MDLVKVPFHGDELLATQDARGVWVPIKRVCEALGVSDEPQRRKLHGKAWACTTMMVAHDASGREQELFFLHLDSLPMWLATIEPSRVAPGVREKLERYQVECARVLRDHFFPAQPAPVPVEALLATVADFFERRLASMELAIRHDGEQRTLAIARRLDVLEARVVRSDGVELGGTIGRRGANLHINHPLQAYADTCTDVVARSGRKSTEWKRVFSRVQAEVRRQVGFTRSWSLLPIARLGEVMALVQDKLRTARADRLPQGVIPFKKKEG